MYSEIKNIEDMKKLHWREFERFIEFVLINKWYKAKVRQWFNDWWIDLDAGFNWQKYFVQCKKWDKYYVWVKDIREFYWAITSTDKNAKWLYVTTSYLSQEATIFARKNNIEVWNRVNLEKQVLNIIWNNSNNIFIKSKKSNWLIYFILFIFVFFWYNFIWFNKDKIVKNTSTTNKVNIIKCDSWYKKVWDKCEKIVIPENSILEYYKWSPWRCEFWYFKVWDKCDKVVIPENSTLRSYINWNIKWECDYGYRRTWEKCDKVIVPENASLSLYKWRYRKCDEWYKLSNNVCIKEYK